MPLNWNINHGDRVVVVVLDDATTAEEIYALLSELIFHRAMSYAKIFDATKAARWIEPARITPLAATVRLYSQMKLGPIGPLAIVVADQKAKARAKEYTEVSRIARAVEIFSNIADASAWISKCRYPPAL